MKKARGLVLWGVAVLLLSCEKEGVLEGSGEKVAVNISLEDIVYKGNETVMRGDYSGAETVRVPLGEGLFMFTTIEEDMETPTRAGVALEEGALVRVVAYNGSTAESTTEYTVVGGVLTTSTALEVNTGTTYNFVAYSYNSAASPTYPGPKITVASPHDLLWGSESKLITSSDNSVSITMDHLFAQVRVKATTNSVVNQPNITNMTGITVTPGNTMDLTIETGVVEQNATVAAQSVSSWPSLNNKTVTSNPITVNTGTANPIYVNIGSVTLAGYSPFTNLKARFNKVLAAGTSYTLVVNFQETIFARSNIYWKSTGTNTGYLTFDTQENGHEGYQGVFFKRGSLVGISPAQPSAGDNSFSSSVPVYKPKADGTGWEISSYSAWTSIPYLQGQVLNVVDDPAAGTGEICRYINSGYKLPVRSDISSISVLYWNTSTVTADGWKMGDGSFTLHGEASNAEGTADLLSDVAVNDPDLTKPRNGAGIKLGSVENQTKGVTLVASGRRWDNSSAGALANVGTEGFYWSVNWIAASDAPFRFSLQHWNFLSAGTQDDTFAGTVRCVRNN
jgi:hypothetical protein